MTEIRELVFDDLWPAIKGRLAVDTVTALLGPSTEPAAARRARVLLPTDAVPPIAEGAIYGRIFVVPVQSAFDVSVTARHESLVRVRVLVEFTEYMPAGWNLAYAMQRIQRAAARRLDGWRPVLTDALVQPAVRQTVLPHSYPMRDVASRMYFTSQEFGALLAPKPTPLAP